MASCGSIEVGSSDPQPVVSNCSLTPSNPTPNQQVNVSALIANQTDNSGTAYVQFFVGGGLVEERQVQLSGTPTGGQTVGVAFSPQALGHSAGDTLNVTVETTLSPTMGSGSGAGLAPQRTDAESVMMGSPSGCGVCGPSTNLGLRVQKGLRRLRTARLR